MTGIVDTVDVSIEIFGGLVTNLAPADLPHGVSPDCQDLQFQIGSVKTRPGITSQYVLPANPSVNYLKTFENLQEVPRLLSLDSLGILRKDATPGGALTTIYPGIIPGAFCRSDSLFAREYLAFGNGVDGLDMPRQYDDTYFDRVSQVGPGSAAFGCGQRSSGKHFRRRAHADGNLRHALGILHAPGAARKLDGSGKQESGRHQHPNRAAERSSQSPVFYGSRAGKFLSPRPARPHLADKQYVHRRQRDHGVDG